MRTTLAGLCALLLCSGVARANALQIKKMQIVDSATGLTRSVPILESTGASGRWQIHREGARLFGELVGKKALPTSIADPMLMVLYAVAEQFGSPIMLVPGHGHAALEEGIDFRIEGIGTDFVYDFCLRFPQVGVGLRTAPTMAERFVHLDPRRPAQCWSEPGDATSSGCVPQNRVPLRSHGPRAFNVLFVDAHDDDRPYWLPVLEDADGSGKLRISPAGRLILQRLFRDRDTGAVRNVPDLLLFRLVQIYVAFGRRPIGILSGVRFTSSVAHSQHPKGTALDFYLPGQDMMQVWRYCLRAFPDGGAGFYPKTAARMAFVHLDVRRSKACWVDPPTTGQPSCPG